MEDKMIHISYEEATTPTDGATVMMNRWWTVYKDGHISVYTAGRPPCKPFGTYSTYSPQCNSNEQIAKWKGKKQAVFLPVVYFRDLLGE